MKCHQWNVQAAKLKIPRQKKSIIEEILSGEAYEEIVDDLNPINQLVQEVEKRFGVLLLTRTQKYYDTLSEQEKLNNEYRLTGKKPEGFDVQLYERYRKNKKAMQNLSQKNTW